MKRKMLPGRQSKNGGRKLALHVLVAAGCFVVWSAPAQGSASLFHNTGDVCTVASFCKAAGDFGMLVGIRNASDQWVGNTVNFQASSSTAGADVNGEVGVGSNGSKLVFGASSASPTWDGPVDFADALSGSSGYCGPSGATACSVASGTSLINGARNIRVTGGTAYEPEHIETAMEQMRDISAYWAGQSGTTIGNNGSGVSNFGRTNGPGTSAFSGTGTQVYTVNGTINTSRDITLTGDATSLFIFNLLSSTSSGTTAAIRLNHNITLDGISPDQVFFNILNASSGTTHVVTTVSGKMLSGVFYVAADSYSLNSTIEGRVMGGQGTSALGTSFVLNAPPDATPEPSTYLLMATGLGAFLYARKRRGGGNGSSTPA